MRKSSIGRCLPLFRQNVIDFQGGTTVRGNQLVLSVVFIIVTLISAGLIPSSATAATYYVSTNGTDARSCAAARNIATPKQTINNTVGCLSAGDTLYVRGGTYAETLIRNIPGGTSWDNPVTVAAYPGNCGTQTCEVVTLRPTATKSRATCVANPETPACISRVIEFSTGQSYIVVDGLTVDVQGAAQEGIRLDTGVPAGTSHHIRIQNSTVTNNSIDYPVSTAGIFVSSSDNEIIKVNIHDIGTSLSGPAPHCIYITGSNNIIERNVCYNAGGWGIHIYHQNFPAANNNIVRYNVVHDVGRVDPEAAGIIIGSGDNNIAHNNIVYNNPNGIYIWSATSSNPTTNNKAYNNTIYKNDKSGNKTGIYVVGGSNAIVKNNIVFANPTPLTDQGTNSILSNNLATDPLFVDAANRNFHLRPGSPAIGAGVAIPFAEFSYDFDGVLRPQPPAPFEIGAYQYQPAGRPSPPKDLRVTP